jgi:hypothetical protein
VPQYQEYRDDRENTVNTKSEREDELIAEDRHSKPTVDFSATSQSVLLTPRNKAEKAASFNGSQKDDEIIIVKHQEYLIT